MTLLTIDNATIIAHHHGLRSLIVALPPAHQAKVAARIELHREVKRGELTSAAARRLGRMCSLIAEETR